MHRSRLWTYHLREFGWRPIILTTDPKYYECHVSDELLELLPPELWYHTLAAIVRLFPGVGPDSGCQDYGDAPSLALENVFNQPLEDLDKLLVRSRSLIVIDWNANREIHSAIRDVSDRQRV